MKPYKLQLVWSLICIFMQGSWVLAQAETVRATVLREAYIVEVLADETIVFRKQLEVRVNDREAAQYYRTDVVYYDPQTEILELKGTVQGRGDKRPITSRKKHLSDHAYYDGFSIATDDRYKKLELDLPDRFPAVYTFSSAVRYKEAVGLPAVYWVHPENVQLNLASLTLIDPHARIQYKVVDPTGLFEERVESDRRSFVLNNLPSLKESQRQHFLTRGPAILLAPKFIEVEGSVGSFATWPEMATWCASLLNDAGELPAAAILEIRELVKDAKSIEEQIALVYAYVQNRSHYVSIQLGIGGWKPMAPADVHATGYGDCKALTNYTRLLLEAVGIDAAYCIIGVDDREIRYPEFASANQANHAMLAVPVHQDTVWLECTSQQAPAGYISNAASGRYALWVGKDSGQLVRTSGSKPEENVLTRQTTIEVARDGSAKLSQLQRRQGNWLDLALALEQDASIDRRELLRNYFTHTLNDLSCSVNIPKGDLNPTGIVRLQATMTTYAKHLGDNLLLPVFAFQKRSTTLEKLVDAEGYVNLDEVSIKRDTVLIIPPKGMRIIQLPKEQVLSSSFLDFSLSAKPVSGGVEIIRELILRKVELEGILLKQAQKLAEDIELADHLVLGVVEE